MLLEAMDGFFVTVVIESDRSAIEGAIVEAMDIVRFGSAED